MWVKGQVAWNKGISNYPELNDKEWLFQKYEIEELTSRQIAKIAGCGGHSAVLQALRKFGIALRKQKEHDLLKDRDWLYEQYWVKELTCKEIAKIVGCDKATALRALKRHNIETRDYLQMQREEENNHFLEKKKKRLSEALKGENNPFYGKGFFGEDNGFYGKHHTKATREIMQQKATKRCESKEERERLSQIRRNQKMPKHHTKPEQIFEEICQRNNLPFHYVGDGSLWIGKDRKLNPDFIEANGKKICVEIFGDYWHSLLLNPKLRESATLPYRKRYYRRYKWMPVFLWGSDLKRPDAEAFVLSVLKKEGVI